MDPRDLRVGDADRDAVVTTLRAAADEGRLTSDELIERAETVRGARTFGDLDRIVADLPVAPPSSRAVAPPPAHPPKLRLEGGMSSDKRSGVWTVPEFIDIHGGMGSVKLDFLQATCDHQIVQVYISGGAGSILLVVPEGWAANIDNVGKSWGSVTSKVPTIATPGSPLLMLSGTMGMGSLKIRGANWWDRRRLRKLNALDTGRQPPALESTAPGWTEQNQELPNSDTLR
ncbi:DUF1707 SHOCT-like domain-containing protein [Propionibacteriaceae bacterium Y2011]